MDWHSFRAFLKKATIDAHVAAAVKGLAKIDIKGDENTMEVDRTAG